MATLVRSSALPGSNVDASSANVVGTMVASDGSILEVGTLSSSTVGAALGQDVKKSGRTTGLTRSSVDGLNATISVGYENECAGGSAFTKTFTGQIIIKNKGSKFLAGGDSGSLMVEDVTSNPRAVGLLFAGSNSLAAANPIGDVLSFLQRIDGRQLIRPPARTGSALRRVASRRGHSLPGASALLLATTSLLAGLGSCSPDREASPTPQDEPTMTADDPELAPLLLALETHAADLMAIPGVQGVAVGLLADGRTPCLQVLITTRTEELEARVPDVLDGHPVVLVESGEIRPLD